MSFSGKSNKYFLHFLAYYAIFQSFFGSLLSIKYVKKEENLVLTYHKPLFSNQIPCSVHRLMPLKDAYKFLLKSHLLHQKAEKGTQ